MGTVFDWVANESLAGGQSAFGRAGRLPPCRLAKIDNLFGLERKGESKAPPNCWRARRGKLPQSEGL